MAVWEVVLEGRQGINDMLNVFHYQDGGGPAPSFGLIASIFEGHLTDHIIEWCGPRVTWVGITVREDIVGGVGTFEPLPGGVLAGTDASGDQVDVIAMQVKKLSGGLVRPTYGWFMQGGITVHAATANDTWEAATVAGVAAYAEDIRQLDMGAGGTLNMVIKASNPTAPNTQAYSQVSNFTVNTRPRTQRSRLSGSGS
jgi:hypothetical protein